MPAVDSAWARGLLAALALAGCARSSTPLEDAAPAAVSQDPAASVMPTGDGDVSPATPAEVGEDLLPTAVAIMSLVNEMRIEAGVTPLTPSAELITIAFERSQAMVERKYLSHTDPFDFSLPVQSLLESEGARGAVAENLFAADVPLDQVPQATLEAWGGSPSHRALLLDERYQFTGVGLQTDGTWWKVTQILAESIP
jgi:uncharacterized protein YkwD